MTDKEKITEILKAYTKKHNIMASSVILEEYADYLLANGVIVQKQGKWVIAGKDKNDMCIFQCSNCGRKQYGATLYCSTCGFEMINAN